MEACSGAHFLGRALREQDHDVKLIPAQFVKPFVKSNKNDFLDAEAIAEAVDRQNMRFVPIKTDDQLDLQALQLKNYISRPNPSGRKRGQGRRTLS
jgi:transposase